MRVNVESSALPDITWVQGTQAWMRIRLWDDGDLRYLKGSRCESR